MAEAFLSASVKVLLDEIISREFVNFFRSQKLDVSLLEKLKTTLLSIQAVLNDAEEKQMTDPYVKEWLDKLRDAVAEADNLLDEINTESLRCKVEAEYQSQTVSVKVRNFLSSRFNRFNREINSKLQIQFERLEHLRKQKLGLKGGSSSVWHGTPTSSVVDESGIYGRDGDRRTLRDYLLSEDASHSGSKIGVISIVGMGGIGKTTLAKLLYNDPVVKEEFNLKAWTHISKDFDVYSVTKTLLESVTSDTIDNNTPSPLHLESFTSKRIDKGDLNTLQMQLQQSLSHKKFLLVLDDIWDGSYVDWNNLKDIFNAGEVGSKLIITTRDERVALAMQTFLPIHYLTPLQSEDCWSLLAKHAFGTRNCQQRFNLEVIGKEIAKKCDGLPLAAVALGGILRTKLSQDDWDNILKSNIWDLANIEVQPALLLSYHYLPAPLKQCFAYCSIFPKNSKLEKKMIIQLWIAEGLVLQSKSGKSMEQVGGEYFDELVSRSLIQQLFIAGEANFEMHDLMNDLAAMVSFAYCIRLDEQKPHQSLESVRHLSYKRGQYDCYKKFDTLHRLKGLRTFLALPLAEQQMPWMSFCYLSNKVIHDMLPAMKQLRVLSLSHYLNITKLPNSIGNLIHLRYLNLSHTNIKRLPYVTCNLYNLQTLLLSGCWRLTELPKDMGKLVNLRHLDVSGTHLQEMPMQIASLQNLQTLSDFVVSKQQDGLMIAELRNFLHLQGKLSISKLQNITNPYDAFQANLKMKEQIDELGLKWDWYGAITEGSQIQTLVVEQLQPSTNLKKLTINGYGGTSFPNWLGDSSFGNMVSLCIGGCHHCPSLPPLGQLHSLKELIISGMISVKIVGTEFYGSISPSFQPFPSLETLTFSSMPEWETWNLIGGTTTEFPSLRYLSLKNCPKLKGNIPSNLPYLSKLKLSQCGLLESGQSNDNSNIISPSDLFSQLVLSFNSLQELTIFGFPSLTSFPRDGLSKTLRSLTIDSCENLDFLPPESFHNYKSLKDLHIFNSCNSMTSFTLGSLPVLKSFHFYRCKNLKWIFIVEEGSQCLSFLQSIKIWGCHELESFFPGRLPTPNLIHFHVSNCDKLHSLPQLINTLTGLQKLEIHGLPNLQSFAKEGLPINLRKLDVGNHGGNTAITKWSLERLTCLSVLKIRGDDIVNVLMKMKVEMPLLPISLVTLCISDLNDIKSLDGKWLQHLTSLQNLEISRSPNLTLLPEEGLPPSLSVLSIQNSPLLKASCQRKRGKEWPKVAQIPCIIIRDQMSVHVDTDSL